MGRGRGGAQNRTATTPESISTGWRREASAFFFGCTRAGLRARGAQGATVSSNSSSNAICAGLMMRRAAVRENHPPLSTSGKVCCRPEWRGHSSSKVLLLILAGSRSPGRAQAKIRLPPFCRTGLNGWKCPLRENPVSSRNSRMAASSAGSSFSNSPLGMVQEPASLFFQKGPPGWTRKTSRVPVVHR